MSEAITGHGESLRGDIRCLPSDRPRAIDERRPALGLDHLALSAKRITKKLEFFTSAHRCGRNFSPLFKNEAATSGGPATELDRSGGPQGSQ